MNKQEKILDFEQGKNRRGEALKKIEDAIIASYEAPLELTKNLSVLDEALGSLEDRDEYPMIENAFIEQIMHNYLNCAKEEK